MLRREDLALVKFVCLIWAVNGYRWNEGTLMKVNVGFLKYRRL
jgi:hypothetical protein